MRYFAMPIMLITAIIVGIAVIQSLNLRAMPVQIGAVSKIRPAADIFSKGRTQPAKSGTAVHHKDRLSTGPKARLEVSLIDNTKITLGENAQLTIDEFVYRPAGRNAVSATVIGAFRFTTGLVGKAKQKELVIQTPVAALAVRGTDFWGGPIDGTYGVLVLEGEVSVTTSAGTVILDRPGLGVTISGPDAAPSTPTVWASERISRAVATISF